MSAQKLIEYLLKLTGKNVNASDELQITSGQRARLHSWLKTNGYVINAATLRGKVTVESILGIQSLSKVIKEVDSISESPSFESAGNQSDASTFATTDVTADGLNIGIDIQEVDALIPLEARLDLKSSPDLLGIFSIQEISFAETQGNPPSTLTAIFCIKEAIKKAGGPKYLNLDFSEIKLEFKSGKVIYPGFIIDYSCTAKYAIAFCLSQKYSLSNARPIEKGTNTTVGVNDKKVARNSPWQFWKI